MSLFEPIEKYVDQLDVASISAARKLVLNELAAAIKQQNNEGKTAQLNFICTQNSRRSHFTQIWAQTIAHFFDVNAHCYSGGTEATALFPKVLETLINIGFEAIPLSNEPNPIYAIKFAAIQQPIIGFSKITNHKLNPSTDFIAVMTCSQADAHCTLVFDADKRISLPYDDPKAFDNVAIQADKYLATSTLIAKEMKYVFSQIQ